MKESGILFVSVFVTTLLLLRIVRIRKYLRKRNLKVNIGTIIVIFLPSICSAGQTYTAAEIIHDEVKKKKEEQKMIRKREGEQQRADDYASSITPIIPDFMTNLERKNQRDIYKITDVLISSKDSTISEIVEQTEITEMRVRHLLRFEMNYNIVDERVVEKDADKVQDTNYDNERICTECGTIISTDDVHCSSCGKTSLK